MQLFCAMIIFTFYCTAGVSLVYCKMIFVNKYGREIEIYLDLHFLGSKGQNFAQMDSFLKEIDGNQENICIYVESKFFFDYFEFNNLDCFYRNISKTLNCTRQWSYQDSPQDPSATTWIAWELPHQLLQCKQNISYEFCDPRLKLESVKASAKSSEQIKCSVNSSFEESKKYSPKKAKAAISELFMQKNTEEDGDELLFDKLLASRILYGLRNSNNKKIIVVCGAEHGHFLAERFLPLLKFVKTKSEELPIPELRDYADGTPLSDIHFGRTCQLIHVKADAQTKSKPSVVRKLDF